MHSIPSKGNLRSKFSAHRTKPLEPWGGQVGSEKHTKTTKNRKQGFIDINTGSEIQGTKSQSMQRITFFIKCRIGI